MSLLTSTKANSVVPENEVSIPCNSQVSRALILALVLLSPVWLLGGLIVLNLGLLLTQTALISAVFLILVGAGCVSTFVYVSACLATNRILINQQGLQLPRLMVPWPAQNRFPWRDVRRIHRTASNYGSERKIVVELADATALPIAIGNLSPASELILFRAIQDRLVARQEYRLPATVSPDSAALAQNAPLDTDGAYDGSQVISMDSRLVQQQQALLGKGESSELADGNGLIKRIANSPARFTLLVTPVLIAYFSFVIGLLGVQLTNMPILLVGSAFLAQFLSIALPVVLAFLLFPGLRMSARKKVTIDSISKDSGGLRETVESPTDGSSDMASTGSRAVSTAGNGADNESSSQVRGQSYTQLWMQSLDPELVPAEESKKPPPIVKSKEFREQSYTELWLQALGVEDDKDDKEPDQEPADTSLSEGSKVRHYEIQFEIIRATAGSSFLVTSPGLKGMQVLKRFELKHEGAREQFRDYGERLRELSHPGIVKLHDHFTDGNVGYLVHEYVDGFSLRKQVKQLGPVDERLVVNLTMQMADIVAYMHYQSPPIVHLDLSPDNFQLRRGTKLKLVDLSVPQWLCASNEPHKRLAPYTPKEKARGRPTMRSSIYMIGASLYFLSTGREPKPPGPFHPKAINDRLNGDLDELVAKCTLENESGRFADADDLRSSKSLARLFHVLTTGS